MIKLNKKNKPIGKIERETREAVNYRLEKAGFDGNGRFSSPSLALTRIMEILSDYGFEQDQIPCSWVLSKYPSYSVSLDFAFTNIADLFSPVSVANSVIYIQWFELRPDYFEVLAYLS